MGAPYVSVRRLVENALAAMLAAIEIYNKPQIAYRDEITVTLAVNAWELALKAALRKANHPIYYPKRRGEKYRSIGLDDALARVTARNLWPDSVAGGATTANVRALADYRDRAIHLYNAPGLGAVIYPFMQQNVLNFRDFVFEMFGRDLAASITWQLLPLGSTPPADAVRFLNIDMTVKAPAEVQRFIGDLRRLLDDVQASGGDTARVATIYDINMQSVKKVTSADLVVAVSPGADAKVVVRKTDPNQTHPFSMSDLLAKANERRTGRALNSRDFTVICWKQKLRDQPRYAWKHSNGASWVWSGDALNLFVNTSEADFDAMRREYRDRGRSAD
ncbi:MAG: DUF3644 domain-containing protein [Promicromonosporaceae bacterium]|nr:DUF3644 domain-containing protein [Promicromonosporaceae bacterium]